MSFDSWSGVWSSNIYPKAYGSLSVPITPSTGIVELKIKFDGEVCKDRMMNATGWHATGITSKAIGALQLDNEISVISYKIQEVLPDTINGYYCCSFPNDSGSFSLFRPGSKFK
jgi:hypothetical protein